VRTGSAGRAPVGATRWHGGGVRKFTIRLDDDLAAEVEALAQADDTSVSDTVRAALRDAVERRHRDLQLGARVGRIIDEDRELLERLAR
jgi:Arc/MetJ family transcription regulator